MRLPTFQWMRAVRTQHTNREILIADDPLPVRLRRSRWIVSKRRFDEQQPNAGAAARRTIPSRCDGG
jgi:hypothetical protein